MSETLKQRTRRHPLSLPLGDITSVDVRRMQAKPAREFLLALAYHCINNPASLEVLLANPAGLPAILMSAFDLVERLITASTGLTPEQIDDLDLADQLEIIHIALRLNTGDELKKSLAGIGSMLKDLFAIPASFTPGSTVTVATPGAIRPPNWRPPFESPKNPGDSPTPASSNGDTAPTTSTAAPSSTST
ncbi:hypothetical protein OPIT5_29245 [Opitutaceae bacterium TAV5]|nr:hypothetical protein OPIT5_21875 [Opitutaceae bacterium TAV5]AHF94879.1 hypothetical protein OPIT5_29245 [Opitutaceae bacterium TAV5]